MRNIVMKSLTILLLSWIGTSSGRGIISGINDACFQPKEPGLCLVDFPYFYFDHLTGQCDCFIYGGCFGNNNRFPSMAECMNTCGVSASQQSISEECRQLFENPAALALPVRPSQSSQNLQDISKQKPEEIPEF